MNKSIDMKKNFSRLFAYMQPYKMGLFVAVAFIILSSLFNSIGPFLLGSATDAMLNLLVGGVVVNAGLKVFIMILIALALVYLLYSVFKYLGTYILVGVSQKTIYDLRNKVDDKLRKLPLNYFDTHTYGDILSRLTNDVDTISNSLQTSIDQIITAVTSLIFIFIMMLVISPVLTVIGIITVPLALVFSVKIVKFAQKYFVAQQDTLGEINGYVEEMYTGHTVINAFGKEEAVIADFEEINKELYTSGWISQFLSSTLMPITQAMTNIGYVAVAVVSGILVIYGRLTIGMIQSFIQYLRQFSQPINQTVQISNVLQSTAAAAQRIFEFLDEGEEVVDPLAVEVAKVSDGTVEFKHVKFGYLPFRYLMNDVNFKVKPGSKVAIVGPTGAGKTTLVNLLLRFYDINEGSILVNGVANNKMKREDLREIFGMVLQDSWLFTGSIRENIRYGRLKADDGEVEAAAKAANADGFIKMLPNGYDFKLEEGATNIAQGERQLLTIARAIISDSPIMILDEATSSVDTRTEVLIQNALKNLMKKRTSFVIAHRLSTIKDADMILYMENGDIKETGTHTSLLKKDGLYAKLYNSQFANNNG